ncbi:MAG: phosphonoacetaldehyde hydrolase [Planctomycetaceae bacterium]|nr:phosphonoacetaldehyde hydrolase [Planctomycetaceae bacterium]
MDFVYKRTYRGPVKMVIFDWAGTTVDYGCYAPAVVFIEVFKQFGVEITMDQARAPMGLQKNEHIKAIARIDEVAAQWKAVHGKPCSDADVQKMFEVFQPLQVKCIGDYADIIPGTVETTNALRKMGIKIGSSSGYFTEAMEINFIRAKEQGFEPDTNSWATAPGVPYGRPEPWMVLDNMRQARIYPPEAVVKVGDTKPDISEGINAGTWTIGLAKTGNEVGLNEKEINALPKDVLERKVAKARESLAMMGAHYVVDEISQVLPLIEEINLRLKMGDRP